MQNDPEMLGKRPKVRIPNRLDTRQTADEEQRRAFTVLLIVELDVTKLRRGHDADLRGASMCASANGRQPSSSATRQRITSSARTIKD